MKPNILKTEGKQRELQKYRDLVLAALNYILSGPRGRIKLPNYDAGQYFQELKGLTHQHFAKGRLTLLKQWFRDLTEPFVEDRDLKFNEFLKATTPYDVDIFAAFNLRVEKILASGQIITDNQFYDIQMLVDQLGRNESPDKAKIEMLNVLLGDYESRKAKKVK